MFFAKNYIGGSVGYQLGSIMESKYNPKSGISASIYYQRIKENNNYKIEFKYGIQKVFIENLTDKSYLNSNYNYHYLNFNVNNAIKLLRREKFSFQFLIGPTLQINLRTNSNGFGYNSISIYDIDSTGSLVGTSIVDNWNEVSANSKDLARISIGADLGFNFCFSINRNIDLSIENKYTFYLTNFTRNLLVPNFANGSIDLGFRFKIY
ncbi:MAG: hypothetical protein EBU01_08425 [Crocinitomicaceae bacterium]|nr:hypothetical protein [Crocinitomicaceae bacterium]